MIDYMPDRVCRNYGYGLTGDKAVCDDVFSEDRFGGVAIRDPMRRAARLSRITNRDYTQHRMLLCRQRIGTALGWVR
jgi:hypothetical protein